MKHFRSRHLDRATAIAVAAATSVAGVTVHAGEGGGSTYLQGTYNDFQMGVFGPPGVYLRNDLFFYQGEVQARPLGGRVAAGATQDVWLNTLKLAYLTDTELFGARLGFAAVIPLVSANVSGELAISAVGVDIFRSGSQTGLGDIYVNPLMLNWVNDNHHFTFAPGIVASTGKYDADDLINLGRNYWAFDLAGAYTFLNPQTGFEFSATAGLLFNAENPDTDYRTGTEFHLDWLVGQYFSESFGAGLAGYYYRQLSDDEGDLAAGLTTDDFDGFRGFGTGVGPALVFNAQVGDRTVSIISKALFDVESENRFEGDLYMLTAAWKF